MINVAVVGLGFMGFTHIKAYRKIEGARIAAICDSVRLPKDGILGGVGGNFGADDVVKLDMSQVKAYSAVEELLSNPDVQLVDICVPTPQHPGLVAAALQAGKHVICEKPMARTSALAREMVAAARSSKGFLMPAMCMRFWPEWVWLKQAIVHNTYGRVLAASFRRVTAPPGWGQGIYLKGEESGGALLDLHIHDADFIQFCFGRPKRVVSTGCTRYSGAVDHVLTQYFVESGASVSAEGTWLMNPGFGFNMTFTVHFEQATADYDLSRGEHPLRLAENGQPAKPVPCQGADGYVGELTHMLEAIRTGRPPTIVTPEDGLGAIEICEAEERSVRSGEIVSL